MLVRLDPEVAIAMRDHAVADHPAEACGAVLGRIAPDGTACATAYRPLRNAAPEPTRGFAVDGIELCAVDGSGRDEGLVLLGIFHSHPSGSTAPSAADRTANWPGHVAWIGALDGRGGLDLRTLPLRRARLFAAGGTLIAAPRGNQDGRTSLRSVRPEALGRDSCVCRARTFRIFACREDSPLQ